MFSNKLPDTKSRIFGSSNESSSLYARLSEVTASLTRNKPSEYPESNGLPPLRGKMPSSRQKSNTLPHLGHGPQVQQLYEDESRHHSKFKDDGLPNVNSQGDHSKVRFVLLFWAPIAISVASVAIFIAGKRTLAIYSLFVGPGRRRASRNRTEGGRCVFLEMCH